MEINLTVIIKSKSEYREELKTILMNLAENSRKETACLQYDLHQNIENPDVFIFHEVWKNKEGLDMHQKQLYLSKFIEASDRYLDGEMRVHVTSRLG